MQTQALAQALEELFVKDPAARERMEMALGNPGYVIALLSPNCAEQMVGRCNKALRSEGIEPSLFTLQRAKRELWGDEDRAPDIMSQAQLGASIMELMKGRYTILAMARRLGLQSRTALHQSCRPEALPFFKTVKAMLTALDEERTGRRPAPPPAAAAAVTVATNPWARLRRLAQKDPKRYGSPVIAQMLGMTDKGKKIRRRWQGEFHPDDPLYQAIIKKLPELVSEEGTPRTDEAVGVSTPTEEGSVRGEDLVSPALAVLHAAVEMLTRIGKTDVLTDGDRMNVYREVRKLLTGAGVTPDALARMGRANAINPNDDPFAAIIRDLAKAKGGRS